jgi:hypothetical protein
MNVYIGAVIHFNEAKLFFGIKPFWQYLVNLQVEKALKLYDGQTHSLAENYGGDRRNEGNAISGDKRSGEAKYAVFLLSTTHLLKEKVDRPDEGMVYFSFSLIQAGRS